jgi:pyridoxal phosphate enzyme (YggS family)
LAVSKTKPVEDILEAHARGQIHFGENYVQEAHTKFAELPRALRLHFIGPLQSNKARLLVGIEQLAVVESVHSLKLAAKLDAAVADLRGPGATLDVFLQVNTSGEASKAGFAPGEVAAAAAEVARACPRLGVAGLMTIGAPDTSPEPAAFAALRTARDAVAAALARDPEGLELSMGMSADMEQAVGGRLTLD